MKYFDSEILSNRQVVGDIFTVEVSCNYSSSDEKISDSVAKNDEFSANNSTIIPGQFFMLKLPFEELTLMRPISVFKVDFGSIFFMYRVVGQGTRRLSEMKKGDHIMLLGPCGNGFPTGILKGKIAVLGGGVGIPPLCHTAKMLKTFGCNVDAFLGFKDSVFAIDDFEPYCDNVYVATENGSRGFNGFVTDILNPADYDAVLTCGPEIMMRKVAKMCENSSVDCYCSLENRMACGIGACLGCSIKTKNGMMRVCKDGPVFKSADLFWE